MTQKTAQTKDRIYNSYINEFDNDVKAIELHDTIGIIVTNTSERFSCKLTKTNRVKKNSWRRV